MKNRNNYRYDEYGSYGHSEESGDYSENKPPKKHGVINFFLKVALIVVVLAMMALTLLFYIDVGGVQNIFSFAFIGDKSLLGTFINRDWAAWFESVTSSVESDGTVVVIFVFIEQLLVQAFHILTAAIVCIYMLIILIKFIIAFFKFDQFRLTQNCVSMVKVNLMIYMFFTIFSPKESSVAVGSGVLISLIIGAIALVVVGVLNLVFKFSEITIHNPIEKMCRSLSSLILYAAIFIILLQIRLLDNLFVVFDSMGVLIELIMSGGEFGDTAINLCVCTGLYLVIFITLCIAFGRALKGITGAGRYLTTFNEKLTYKRSSNLGFVGVMIALILAGAAGYVLSLEQFGGIKLEYFTLLIVMLVIAVVGEILWVVFKKVHIGKKEYYY